MILDSGDRTEFETGAVRDMRKGKGRCDLLPLDVIEELFLNECTQAILSHIGQFQMTSDTDWLESAVDCFCEQRDWKTETMILEVAKQFEEGAKKYGDNNWRNGIPVRCYIDSAIRHYMKWLRGDNDESHDRAFCWNILCAIWTCKNKPELNDYEMGDFHEGN